MATRGYENLKYGSSYHSPQSSSNRRAPLSQAYPGRHGSVSHSHDPDHQQQHKQSSVYENGVRRESSTRTHEPEQSQKQKGSDMRHRLSLVEHRRRHKNIADNDTPGGGDSGDDDDDEDDGIHGSLGWTRERPDGGHGGNGDDDEHEGISRGYEWSRKSSNSKRRESETKRAPEVSKSSRHRHLSVGHRSRLPH